MNETQTSSGDEQAPCPRCRSAGSPAPIVAAADAAGAKRPPRRGWLQAAAAAPAAVLPLLPSFTCPACIAAYAGVLSVMGLGFLLNEAVLGPLISAVLVLSVATVGWSTRSHRRPGPLVATVVGALLIAAGRLVWDLPTLLYAGVAVLLAGSLWNLWLKRPRRTPLVRIGGGRPAPASQVVEGRS